jgi:hypothetical protein
MSGHRKYEINMQDVLGRLARYTLEGLVVAIAAYSIPSAKLDAHEIVTIALVAAATLSTLDAVSPSMGSSARFGIGASVGAGLAGFGGHHPKALRR